MDAPPVVVTGAVPEPQPRDEAVRKNQPLGGAAPRVVADAQVHLIAGRLQEIGQQRRVVGARDADHRHALAQAIEIAHDLGR
jgi:hypothetical protein